MAKRAQLNARRKGWWDGTGMTRAGAKAKELFGGAGEVEEGLVRVLSGEEEIANLRTPKGIMITGPPGECTLRLDTDSLELDPADCRHGQIPRSVHLL